MNITAIFNGSLNLCAMAIYVVLLIAALLAGNLRQPVYRWFFFMVLFNSIGIASELVVELLGGTPGAGVRTVCIVLDYVSYVIMGASFFSFASFLYEFLNLKTSVPRWVLRLMRGLAAAIIALATIAQPTRLYSDFDSYNRYIQQPTFWVSLVIPFILAIIGIVVILRCARVLRSRELISLLLYPIAPVACYLLEIIHPELWVAQFGNAVTMLLMYTTLHMELRGQLARRDAELSEARVSIMLSQIHPHFLYNTLNSISESLDEIKEADQANEALVSFAHYLRANMDSITQKEPIPFEKELEHTKQYLWLEQFRFEERLQIEYDIQTVDFMISALTLQPIVENAVRHGVTEMRSGGTVKIRTEEAEDSFRVIVADNGVGFDLNAAARQNARSHVGISNVRNRLAAMCGGKLLIESTPGKGTTATIMIPKDRGVD